MASLNYSIGANTSGLERGISKASRLVGGMAGKLSALAGGYGLYKIGESMLTQAANTESLTMSYTALMGSAKAADDVLGRLDAKARATGQSFLGMADTVRKLMANGMSAGEAAKFNDVLADVTSTMGMGAAEADLLGSAFAQVQSKGIASMEELRGQIAERGIPIFDAMAASMGKSKAEVMALVGAGKVASSEVMDAFTNMAGPLANFKGGAEKASKTLAGSFGILKEETRAFLAESGGGMAETAKTILRSLTGLVKTVGPFIGKLVSAGATLVGILVEAFNQGVLPTILINGLVWAGKGFINVLAAGMMAIGKAFWEALKMSANLVVAGFKVVTNPDFWKGLWDIMKALGKMIAAGFLMMLPDRLGGGKGQGMMAEASAEMDAGTAKIMGAATPYFEAWSDGLGKIMEGFKEGLGYQLLDTSAESDQVVGIITDLMETIDKRSQPAAAAEVGAIQKMMDVVSSIAGVLPKGADQKKGFGGMTSGPIVDSLSRVGGSSLFGAKSSLDTERNSLLRRNNELVEKLVEKMNLGFV